MLRRHPLLGALGLLLFGLTVAVFVAVYLSSSHIAGRGQTGSSERKGKGKEVRRPKQRYSRPIIAGAAAPIAPMAPVAPDIITFNRWQRYLAQAIGIAIGAALTVYITEFSAGIL
jgi:hypothetical protein